MEISEKIESLINDNDVCLFMKERLTHLSGFSMAVSNVLKHLKLILRVNVLEVQF